MSSFRAADEPRPFSLRLYLLIVFGLSWPLFIAYALWGDTPIRSILFSSLAMMMVIVGTFICGKWVFRDGFRNMGWKWGKPSQYLAVFALALFIFGLPVLLENGLGLHALPAGLALGPILGGFLTKMVITILPGFGEEFGWRAYLLPRLVQRYSLRKALLLHGLIWWAWHLPALVGIGLHTDTASPAWISVAFTLLITLIPSVMNATLYAYVWSATQSLAVVSVYHALYDEVRDTLEQSIGFGPLVSLWEMAATTVIGAILLWKGSWKYLQERNVRLERKD